MGQSFRRHTKATYWSCSFWEVDRTSSSSVSSRSSSEAVPLFWRYVRSLWTRKESQKRSSPSDCRFRHPANSEQRSDLRRQEATRSLEEVLRCSTVASSRLRRGEEESASSSSQVTSSSPRSLDSLATRTQSAPLLLQLKRSDWRNSGKQAPVSLP